MIVELTHGGPGGSGYHSGLGYGSELHRSNNTGWSV